MSGRGGFLSRIFNDSTTMMGVAGAGILVVMTVGTYLASNESGAKTDKDVDWSDGSGADSSQGARRSPLESSEARRRAELARGDASMDTTRLLLASDEMPGDAGSGGKNRGKIDAFEGVGVGKNQVSTAEASKGDEKIDLSEDMIRDEDAAAGPAGRAAGDLSKMGAIARMKRAFTSQGGGGGGGLFGGFGDKKGGSDSRSHDPYTARQEEREKNKRKFFGFMRADGKDGGGKQVGPGGYGNAGNAGRTGLEGVMGAFSQGRQAAPGPNVSVVPGGGDTGGGGGGGGGGGANPNGAQGGGAGPAEGDVGGDPGDGADTGPPAEEPLAEEPLAEEPPAEEPPPEDAPPEDAQDDVVAMGGPATELCKTGNCLLLHDSKESYLNVAKCPAGFRRVTTNIPVNGSAACLESKVSDPNKYQDIYMPNTGEGQYIPYKPVNIAQCKNLATGVYPSGAAKGQLYCKEGLAGQ